MSGRRFEIVLAEDDAELVTSAAARLSLSPEALLSRLIHVSCSVEDEQDEVSDLLEKVLLHSKGSSGARVIDAAYWDELRAKVRSKLEQRRAG